MTKERSRSRQRGADHLARKDFSHIDSEGKARMVDVSGKGTSARKAAAEALVYVGPEIAGKLRKAGRMEKGNVFDTARVAGIMAGKRAAHLIPMCHPLPIDHVGVDLLLEEETVRIRAEAKTEAKTGVEMECMVAAAVAALTVYDMCKSAGKGIEIRSVRLLEKSGGRSGDWKRT